MSLDSDVERLRARLAALQAGEPEPTIEAPKPRERAATIVEFWHQVYESTHGFAPVIVAKDAVNLHRLAKLYEPKERFAWMIRAYHELPDEFVAEAGYSVSIFTTRAQGLAFKWVKTVSEPALRREKLELERQIRDLAADPKVASAIERVLKVVP
jgi:hypothetical protein